MQTDSKKHDTTTDANNVLAAGFRSFQNMQTDSKKHDTTTDANNVLAAGFRSVREAKRFSKMYALLQVLNSQVDAMNDAVS